MQKSESITNLAAALAKAQGNMAGALKDSENPHFRSKYADLESVWNACREPLTSNGLSVTQLLTYTERQAVAIETLLLHESGEYIGSSFEIPVSKSDAQGFGSALTYARRYSLSAIIGIAPAEDDGESAVGRGTTAKKTASTPPTAKQADSSGTSQGGSQPKTEKTPPASNTEADTKAAEYHDRIRGALRQIYGEDKAAALAYVENETVWIDKATGEVKAAGVKDYRKLSEGRSKVLCSKLEARIKKESPPTVEQQEPDPF
jgi:hypothetical protein